jgi:hypothetical protein
MWTKRKVPWTKPQAVHRGPFMDWAASVFDALPAAASGLACCREGFERQRKTDLR